MKVIGITGGVGAGKSEVLKELQSRPRTYILLADEVAKEIELPGHTCYDRLVALLTKDILNQDGTINNAKMANAIFADKSLLQQVNGIVHPEVKEYILKDIEQKEQSKEYDYFFLEAALLIEDGYLKIVDEMWYIYAREEIRRQRLKSSRGYSDEKIDSIMKKQLSEDEFRLNCHIVIDNSNSIQDTIIQIDKVLGEKQ